MQRMSTLRALVFPVKKRLLQSAPVPHQGGGTEYGHRYTDHMSAIENPACQTSCGFEALTYDEKLKIVVVDGEKCTGCQACVGACPYGIITIDPATKKAIKCDLCGGAEPVCVSICPSNVLSALDDIKAGEYRRRRFAALLAFDDEVQRKTPGGEEPTQKMLEKRG